MVSPCHLQAWARPWLVGPGPRKPNEEVKTCGLPLSPPGLGPPLVGGPRTKEAECQGTRWDGGWCHSVSKAWVHTLGGVSLRVQPGSLGTPGFTDDTGGLAVRRAREAL